MGVLVTSQVHALVELARTGSMAAAAEALGYTAGAVSQQIARLEQVVGAPLVHRVGRGVRLTDAGRILADHAQCLVSEEESALQSTRAAAAGSPSGAVTIGVFGSTSGAILTPMLIETLARRQPDLEVQSIELAVDDCGPAVGRGLVDVAFGVDYTLAPVPRSPSTRFVQLRRERFDLAVGPALAGRGEMSLRELADTAWILASPDSHYTHAWQNACRRAGFEPRVRHQITDTAATLALAKAGTAVAPVTPLMRRLLGSDVPVVRLRETVERDIVLIRHQVDRDRATIRAVIAAAREVVNSALLPPQHTGAPWGASSRYAADRPGSADAWLVPGRRS